MPPEPYATVSDLTTPGRFPRPLTEAELAQVPTMLADASFILSVQAPGLTEAVAAEAETGEVGPVTYAAMLLTVTMVRRALLAQSSQQTTNPNVDSVSETWGTYGQSIKYRQPGTNLFLYERELDELLDLLGGASTKAVSMRSKGL